MSFTADDIRDAFLTAAAQLFAEGGAAAVTARAVCERVGLSPPTIYRHFGDMAGLLTELADRTIDETIAAGQSLGDISVEAVRLVVGHASADGWARYIATRQGAAEDVGWQVFRAAGVEVGTEVAPC